MKNFFSKFKITVTLKEVGIWFALSFVGVLLVFLMIVKRTFNGMLLIEVLGYSLVFVLLMIGTKSYSHFIDGYYQGHIDSREKKEQRNKNNQAKNSKNKKRVVK